ncbi:hypothetical protein ACN28S_65355 [Cystobacter fuscus]
MNGPSSPASSSPPNGRVTGLVGVLCALAVLMSTFALEPDYWRQRGFPLDDAWIHAVYARSVAWGEGLDYNPGVPATGETSPLWAIVLSVAYLGEPGVERSVLVTKLLGFLLHALTAAGCYRMFRDAGRRWAASAALLVLVSPHLVAASISGMEVPLATLVAVGCVLVLLGQRPGLYALCGAAGLLARPEGGLFVFLLPLVVRPQPGLRPLVRRWVEAGVGVALAGGAWAAWNLHASGRPLPGTFYAKVTTRPDEPVFLSMLRAAALGLWELLPELALPWPVLIVLAVLALRAAVYRRSVTDPERRAAGLLAVGLVFFAVSMALLRSAISQIFYLQRYVLPALPFILAPLPILLGAWMEARLAEQGPRLPALVAVALPLVVATGLVPRLERLENDAHNIDDLQVREGLFLARASPEDVVWVLDAGASRFFGRAFVVDLLALNSPRMLDSDAQAYLDEHPPRFLEWTRGWAALRPDTPSGLREAATFQTTTPYTVSAAQAMDTRVLLECVPGSGGIYTRKRNNWRYQCAAPTGAPRGLTPEGP